MKSLTEHLRINVPARGGFINITPKIESPKNGFQPRSLPDILEIRKTTPFCRFLILITCALLFFSTPDADGCACCADAGQYRLRVNQPLSDYQRAQLDEMKFASDAHLFLTDAGEDAVKGLGSISEENSVRAVREPKRWRLTFRAEDGQTGVLTIPVPTRMTAFAADIHDGPPGKSPALYKEWRFEGVASGDGIFKSGFIAPARYTLVFQGRGNSCDNAADFTHWRLEIAGGKASYAFFGELVSDAAPPKSDS
jgi:hypothetical protein